jgi:CHAT domain-containing protein
MSKVRKDGFPWFGWRWVPTAAAAARRAAAARTALPAVSLLGFILLLCVGCGRFGAEAAYRRADASYRRGDLAQAAKEALRAADERRSQRDRSPWYWSFRLLASEALIYQANYHDAEELLGDTIPTQFTQVHARQLIDRGLLGLYRSGEAGDWLRQARGLARDPDLAIRLELVAGNQEYFRRHNEQAQAFYRAGLERAVRFADPYYLASALNNMSLISKRLNRFEESIEFGERALAEAGKAGARRTEAQVHTNVGPSYAYLGQFDAALRHERKGVEMLRQMGMRHPEMIAFGELGLIQDLAGDFSGAIPNHRQAFDMARDLGSKRDATRFAENLALTFIRSSQWPEAEEWNHRAEELAAVTGENLVYLERNRALIARAMGRPDEASRIANQLLADPKAPPEIHWAAHDLLGRIENDAGRRPRAGAEFAKALASIEGAQSALADAQHKITLLSYLIPFYQDYVQVLAEQKDDAAALRVVESSRARVLAERMGRNVQPAMAPSLDAVREFARKVNASILTFWLAPEHSYAWLIRPEGVSRFALPPAPQVEALVTGYRKIVEHSTRDPLTGADPALWNGVMAQIAAAIPKGSYVIVIPDGPLHRLNLETLVVPGPTPHYWIEDVEIVVAPSITIAMAASPARHAERGMLAIGDPDYRGTGYDPLPAAARELREVLARFGGASPTVITGAKASPAAYRLAQPERFAAIHFAAHAEANEERPLESAVVLARAGDSYKLYARDVVDIPILAELVTLSACRSAGAREYAGEGLIGFAWAFLQAGAKSVVAGLWDVSDVSAEPLMAKFYEGMNARHDPVSALREAKLSLLHGGPRFQKAFYWGAFQAYVGSLGR